MKTFHDEIINLEKNVFKSCFMFLGQIIPEFKSLGLYGLLFYTDI